MKILTTLAGGSRATKEREKSVSHQIGSILKKLPRFVIVGLAASLTATGAAPALAGGIATQTHIVEFGLVSTLGNMVFIEVFDYKTNNPSCSTSGPGQWAFVLPLTTPIQQQMYTTLLAARAQGSPVTLVGSGICDIYGTVETLTNVLY
jgi:hypothetical protein